MFFFCSTDSSSSLGQEDDVFFATSRHSPRNTDAACWHEAKGVLSQSFYLIVKHGKKNVLRELFQIVLQLNYLQGSYRFKMNQSICFSRKGAELILEGTYSATFLAQ